ncbi:hypothetical protein CRG98_046541 [Punica granatum]|uniref:Uncharacterized protein n=1 Tax=Punica granatum TaxID=22663 RepID=A0A2I0HMW9_PUNGR|nr:hypothetical protein CRG98_046541 [Punica granatum]
MDSLPEQEENKKKWLHRGVQIVGEIGEGVRLGHRDVGILGEKGRGEEEREKEGKKRKLSGLGLGFARIRLGLRPNQSWDSPVWTESGIAESAQFHDSAIQLAIHVRFCIFQLTPLLGIVCPSSNRRIVRFYDSNHDSENHDSIGTE